MLHWCIKKGLFKIGFPILKEPHAIIMKNRMQKPANHYKQNGSLVFFSCSRIPLVESSAGTPPGSLPTRSTPPGPDTLSSQVYYSVECSGLENKLNDCTWSRKYKTSAKRDVMVLCRESKNIMCRHSMRNMQTK